FLPRARGIKVVGLPLLKGCSVMDPELRVELQHLLSALCDGELSDAEHARLESLLESDAECRRVYLAYLDMHAHLLVHPCPVPAASGADSLEPVAEVPAAGWRLPAAVRYGVVIAATLAASLLLQVVWRGASAQTIKEATTGPIAGKPPRPSYLATL